MRMASFLALAGALLLPAAHADVVVFTATGTYQNGDTLSGTVTINRSTGLAVGGDLAVSGIPADFTALVGQLTWPPASPFMTELDFENGQATDNYLTLLFQPDSLVGYDGGPFAA